MAVSLVKILAISLKLRNAKFLYETFKNVVILLFWIKSSACKNTQKLKQ